eukprot:GHVT01101454.1.p1 GENE.GHVT01101454.1~~GHVT01101454.1.p1  ORF type:complete len:290 (-),score=68.70 GHVT01101454.1:604-1473(-)
MENEIAAPVLSPGGLDVSLPVVKARPLAASNEAPVFQPLPAKPGPAGPAPFQDLVALPSKVEESPSAQAAGGSPEVAGRDSSQATAAAAATAAPVAAAAFDSAGLSVVSLDSSQALAGDQPSSHKLQSAAPGSLAAAVTPPAARVEDSQASFTAAREGAPPTTTPFSWNMQWTPRPFPACCSNLLPALSPPYAASYSRLVAWAAPRGVMSVGSLTRSLRSFTGVSDLYCRAAADTAEELVVLALPVCGQCVEATGIAAMNGTCETIEEMNFFDDVVEPLAKVIANEKVL